LAFAKSPKLLHELKYAGGYVYQKANAQAIFCGFPESLQAKMNFKLRNMEIRLEKSTTKLKNKWDGLIYKDFFWAYFGRIREYFYTTGQSEFQLLCISAINMLCNCN
jgi:hypothetical protein